MRGGLAQRDLLRVPGEGQGALACHPPTSVCRNEDGGSGVPGQDGHPPSLPQLSWPAGAQRWVPGSRVEVLLPGQPALPPPRGWGPVRPLYLQESRPPQAAQGRQGWPGADKRGDHWPSARGCARGPPGSGMQSSCTMPPSAVTRALPAPPLPLQFPVGPSHHTHRTHGCTHRHTCTSRKAGSPVEPGAQRLQGLLRGKRPFPPQGGKEPSA